MAMLLGYVDSGGGSMGRALFVVVAVALMCAPAVLASVIAQKKGRSGFVWFFVALPFNILALLVLLALPDAGSD
jgi:hypothetical protein